MELSAEVKKLSGEVVRLRRRIHRHPERGFQEAETSGLIQTTLRSAGVPFRTMCETGVVALIRGGRPGPTLMIRADMDGLPVQEENNVPFRSKVPGVMHACGHDGHVAVSLAAARILQKARGTLAGNVKFMFQPAEEGPGGAEPMIRAGLLKNPDVDAAIALHMWNDLPTGVIGVREGPVFAAVDEFYLTIRGRGGHGAAPHQTIDPVVIAAQVVTNLQSVISRRVDPIESAVVTVGKIQGGTRFNIIPDSVTLEGTVRTFRPAVRNQIEKELRRIVRGVTDAHAATFELRYQRSYPATVNHPEITKLVREAAADLVGRRAVVRQDLTLGAEDMSYVLEEVPGCYFMLGSANEKKGLTEPHHSPRFNFDEDALPIGVELLVRTAKRYLS